MDIYYLSTLIPDEGPLATETACTTCLTNPRIFLQPTLFASLTDDPSATAIAQSYALSQMATLSTKIRAVDANSSSTSFAFSTCIPTMPPAQESLCYTSRLPFMSIPDNTFMPVVYTTASVLTVSVNGPVVRAPPAGAAIPSEGGGPALSQNLMGVPAMQTPEAQPPGSDNPTPQPQNPQGGGGGQQQPPVTPAPGGGGGGGAAPSGVNRIAADPGGFILGNAQVTPIQSGAQSGGAVVGGQTVTPGQQVTLPGGDVASIPSAGGVVVINGQTASLAANTPVPGGANGGNGGGNGPTPTFVGGAIITPAPNGAGVVVGGVTIQSGILQVGGQTLSIGSGVVVVNGQTSQLGSAPLTFGGANLTPVAGGSVVISGVTLGAGALTTLGGEVVSVGPSGVVVVNGVTNVLTPAPAAPTAQVITLNGVTATPLPNGGAVVSGTTLTAGQTATIGSATITLQPTGLVVNGVTASLPAAMVTPSAMPVVFNGETITPFTSGTVVVNGVTLTPGESTVIDGHTLSVGTSGTVLVDGTPTQLPTVVPATSTRLTSGSGTNNGTTSETTSSSSSTDTTTTTSGPGGAIASGIGATKKGRAARSNYSEKLVLASTILVALVYIL
jgi:hypothetical protein